MQYQIESYTAQQHTYDDLISYSTVDVTVEEVKQITEKPRRSATAHPTPSAAAGATSATVHRTLPWALSPRCPRCWCWPYWPQWP
ncbi:MAG: DUF4349 domain-containing protein [Ruthenibacterium lactatiformans]